MSTAVSTQKPVPDSPVEGAEEGIDLLALLAAFVCEWRLGVAITAIVTVLASAFVFHLKSQFVASATILPEAGHVVSDPLASLFASRSPAVIFAGLLRSRFVADDVIEQAHLKSIYKVQSMEVARAQLAGQSTFQVGTEGILTVSVKDRDANTATIIANAYITALDHLDLAMARDQSHQMQEFFVQELEQEKEDLFQAEDQLEQLQKNTGVIQPETQTQIGLNAIAGVRAEVVNLRVQLASVLQGATEQSPQVQRLRSQIAQLEAQEHAMENGGNSPVGAAPPAGKLPQTNLNLLRAQREVKYHEGLVASLSTEYESTRLSENLSRPAFQLIDRATPPERKSWPPRRMFLLIGLAVGVICGMVAIFLRLFLRRVLRDPANAASLAMMRRAFGRG